MQRFIQSICTRRVQLISLLVFASIICVYQLWRTTEFNRQCREVNVIPFIVSPYNESRIHSELPDLYKIQWPKPPVAPYPVGSRTPLGILRPLPKRLEPVMSIGQRRLSKRLLKVFSDMMFANGLGDRFILAGGTLVGSYLFHDFVPWDDDVDVFVHYPLRGKVQSLLNGLPKPYRWHATQVRDKLFTETLPKNQASSDLEMSRRLFRHPWAWPFLDICYFNLNGTHFWEFISHPQKADDFISRSVIFPTTFRPLGTEWYPTPRNTRRFLRLWYKKEIGCLNKPYSHAFEMNIKGHELPCQMLLHQYAQVRTNLVRRAAITVLGDGLIWRNYSVIRESLVKHTDFGQVVIHQLCIPRLDGPGD